MALSNLERKNLEMQLLQVKAALCSQEYRQMQLEEEKQRLDLAKDVQQKKIEEIEALLA